MSYPPTPLVGADAQLRQRSILSQVYAWMTAGLLVTSAVAAYTASAPIMLSQSRFLPCAGVQRRCALFSGSARSRGCGHWPTVYVLRFAWCSSCVCRLPFFLYLHTHPSLAAKCIRLTASLQADLAKRYRAAHWPSSRWIVLLSSSACSSLRIDACSIRQPKVSNGGTVVRRSL
jgi:hypothetical protein